MLVRATCLTLLLIAVPASANAQERAITRAGQRLDDPNQLPDQQESDFADIVVDEELSQLVSQLASDDYAEREAATDTLLERRFDRAQIYKLLAGYSLNAEQRHRLLAIVVEQLLTTPRGAVGIQLHWEDGPIGDPGAIVVDGIVPGMPAEQSLQVADRIVLCNGQAMMQQNDFVMHVQGRQPGETVRFTIERAKRNANGENLFDEQGNPRYDTLNVTIALGSVEDLEAVNRGRAMGSPILNQIQGEIAWAVRRFSPPRRSLPLPQSLNATAGIANLEPSPFDDHPAIVTLLYQKQRLEAGMIKNDASTLAEWRAQYAQLVFQAGDAELSDEQRNYLRGVVQRYAEIMNR